MRLASGESLKLAPGFVIVSVFSALILLFSLSCQNQEQAPASDAAAIVVDSVASEDGVIVYYDVRGSGDRTLVFVHGWSCDRSYWQEQVEAFADDYRVVTIDLAGHGQSGLGREEWTMAAFGADVAAVIEKLQPKESILIGHSMGGPVIIEAARRRPDGIVALIGVDNFQNFQHRFPQEQIDSFLVPWRTDFKANADSFVRRMFPPDADSQLVNLVAADMSSAPLEVAVDAIGHTLGYDFASALQEMRLPIRAVCANRYPVDVEGNRQLAQSFEVKIMDGPGHFLHMEDPETFNTLLAETIEEFWPKEVTQ